MFKIRPWRLLMFTEIKTMRTVLWLFTAAALWFLAWLYQMELLAVLFLVQLLLFLFMAAASFYLKASAELSIVRPKTQVFCGRRASVRMRVDNRGIIPISRFQVMVTVKTALWMRKKAACSRAAVLPVPGRRWFLPWSGRPAEF